MTFLILKYVWKWSEGGLLCMNNLYHVLSYHISKTRFLLSFLTKKTFSWLVVRLLWGWGIADWFLRYYEGTIRRDTMIIILCSKFWDPKTRNHLIFIQIDYIIFLFTNNLFPINYWTLQSILIDKYLNPFTFVLSKFQNLSSSQPGCIPC